MPTTFPSLRCRGARARDGGQQANDECGGMKDETRPHPPEESTKSLVSQHLKRSGVCGGRKKGVELEEVVRCQPLFERAEVFFEPVAAAAFRNDDDVVACEQPRERGLGGSHATELRESTELGIARELPLLDR